MATSKQEKTAHLNVRERKTIRTKNGAAALFLMLVFAVASSLVGLSKITIQQFTQQQREPISNAPDNASEILDTVVPASNHFSNDRVVVTSEKSSGNGGMKGTTIQKQQAEALGPSRNETTSNNLWTNLFPSQAMFLPPKPRLITKYDASKPEPIAMDYLTPLRPVDREYYTIRINTFKRHNFLALSVHHHISCPGVAQIQVIWYADDFDRNIPKVLEDFANQTITINTTTTLGDMKSPKAVTIPRLVFERHSINSLNQRFQIIQPTPTLGILSMDDDVFRPCEAIDSAFFQWTLNYDRMVGFDARGHSLKGDAWMYRGEHQTKDAGYSMTLPRYSFIHRDYMDWYMHHLPRSIFRRVRAWMNCEDIAMSLFVSSLTGGQRPILADRWAMWAMIAPTPTNAISSRRMHRAKRNVCADIFSTELHLRKVVANSNNTGETTAANGTKYLTMGPMEPWDTSYMMNVSATTGGQGEVEFVIHHGRFEAAKAVFESYQGLSARDVRIRIKKFTGRMHRWNKYRLLSWNTSGVYPD